MKSTFRKSTIALAVATLTASGAAMAQGVTSTTSNLVDVQMNKSLSLSKQITINGGIIVNGLLTPDSSAVAVIDDKQFNSGNSGGQELAQNQNLTNEASSSDNMLNGATGNIAVNMNAGDNNMQDNAAAMASAADSTFVFGLVDSEVFVHQDANTNNTVNHSVNNQATIGQSSFAGSAGNLGVNFAAGNSNLQKNNFSSSVASAGIAEASVNTQQHSTANLTSNNGTYTPVVNGQPGAVSGHFESESVTLTNPEGQLWTGFGQGNMAGSYGSDAIVNEENGSFLVNGTPSPANLYSASHTGSIGANENSIYEFAAIFTGNVEYFVIDECAACVGAGGTTFATNTVRLDNQAFMNAGGNIGANMASGSGNLQSNSLSMSVTP